MHAHLVKGCFLMIIILAIIIIIMIATMIRRFKKKKENKALTEAPTDKSTVFQAFPSTLNYNHLGHHVLHRDHHVVSHDDDDDDSGGSANIARGWTRAAAHNLH